MRKDKLITINSKTSKVFIDNFVLGVDNENLQGNLIFNFDDEFVDGTARLEIEINGTKSYTMLTKEEETYTLPIKSFLTKKGKVNMQLVITEGEDPEEIPVFKSNIFWLIVNSSINAEIEQPEEYAQWIDVANEKLNELDNAIEEANNLDIEVEKIDNTTTVTITKKDGTTEEVEILDGEKGADGKDAKINGVNTLTIEAGDNIELDQEGSTLTISATGGGGGTSDYTDLTNKPKINNVELSGNKTTSDLGISYDDLTNKPDLSQYITKTVDDLINYYKKSETYTQAEINALIGAISTLNLLVVQTLPTEDISTTTIYLVPKTTSETNNVYDEYIYVSNAWEKIGSTEVDLSNYYTKTETNALLNDKQDTLTAGDNITIENNVISATGGGSTYFLTTPFTTATASTSLNSDDIATLNKVIDDYRAGKDFVLIAKKMMFKTNNSITQYSYNVIGNVRGSNKTFYIDFYRSTGAGTNAYPISFADNSLVRTITLNNVSTPANISSASLPTQPTVNSNDNIITTGNTTSYNVTGDYNPAHKKYVDDTINPTITTDSGTTYTIASLIGNQSYKLGELTSLTITATTTFDRESVIYFTSGTTPTDISIPDTIVNLGDAPTMTASGGVNTGTCEASKSYIIAILNNIAVWKAY